MFASTLCEALFRIAYVVKMISCCVKIVTAFRVKASHHGLAFVQKKCVFRDGS